MEMRAIAVDLFCAVVWDNANSPKHSRLSSTTTTLAPLLLFVLRLSTFLSFSLLLYLFLSHFLRVKSVLVAKHPICSPEQNSERRALPTKSGSLERVKKKYEKQKLAPETGKYHCM